MMYVVIMDDDDLCRDLWFQQQTLSNGVGLSIESNVDRVNTYMNKLEAYLKVGDLYLAITLHRIVSCLLQHYLTAAIYREAKLY
jgi:hypothetical protein